MFLFVNEVVLSAFCIEGSSLRLIMIILIVIIGKDLVDGRVSLGLASSRIQGILSKTFGRGKWCLQGILSLAPVKSVKKQEKLQNSLNMAGISIHVARNDLLDV